MERKPSHPLTWTVWTTIVAVLFVGLYVGAYYAMVIHGSVLWMGHGFVPYYRILQMELPQSVNSSLRLLFAPIHQIDRTIRADYWRPPACWQ